MNYIGVDNLISREGQLGKSGKTGSPIVIHNGKWAILDQNLANPPPYLFLDVQLEFYCIIRNYSLKNENIN